MSDPTGDALRGAIIDERVEVTIDEVCLFCAAPREEIVALVEVGILEPRGEDADRWRFGGHSLRRAGKAVRLRRDLEIDFHAVALVLDLLDELDALRAQLRPPAERS